MQAKGVFGLFAVSACILFFFFHTTGEGPANGKAFIRRATKAESWCLIVNLEFQHLEAKDTFIREWDEIALWVQDNESFLLNYEILQSDADAKKVVIFERYASKQDYLEQHKSSSAFKVFRPKMQAMQDKGLLVVTGTSYTDTIYGFARSY